MNYLQEKALRSANELERFRKRIHLPTLQAAAMLSSVQGITEQLHRSTAAAQLASLTVANRLAESQMLATERIRTQLEGIGGLQTNIENISATLSGLNFHPQVQLTGRILRNDGAIEAFTNTVASIGAVLEASSPLRVFQDDIRNLAGAYLTFSQHQLDKFVLGEHKAYVAATILDHTDELFFESSALVHFSLEESQEDEVDDDLRVEHSLLDASRFNVFRALSQHLSPHYSAKRRLLLERAIKKSLPVKVHALGCDLVRLVYELNLYVQLSGRGLELFKPTNRSVHASLILPNLIASNDQEFGDIVDHLFFILYEGSGTANRLKPLLTDSELRPLWIVKHLRRYTRHDVEHGQDIRKKLRETGIAFEELIDSPHPTSAADWKRAQLALYRKLVSMLKIIYDRLTTTQ